MALREAEHTIEKNGACRDRYPIPESFETDLDWVGIIHRLERQREEVQQAVEVHSGDEGDDIGECNDSLAREQLVWDHGVLGSFPLPNDEGDD